MATVGGDRVPEVFGVVITMLTLAAIFVFARTITRTMIRPSFGWDDALIIITWFLQLGFSVALLVAARYGYGKPMDDLTLEGVTAALRAMTVAEVFAVLTFPTAKASIAYLLLRLFPGRTLRWILWSFVAGNAVLFYLNAVFILIQCHPVEFTWNRSIEGGSCWHPSIMRNWGLITGIFGAVTDCVFATLPWYYVRRLQMKKKEKLGVSIALGMGLLATVCAIVKIKLTIGFWSQTDVTYGTVPLTLWGCSEIGLINVAACIPTLRPLYLYMTGKNPRSVSPKTSTTHLLKDSKMSKVFRSFIDSPFGESGTLQPESSTISNLSIYHVRSFKVTHQDRDEESSEDGSRAAPTFVPRI